MGNARARAAGRGPALRPARSPDGPPPRCARAPTYAPRPCRRIGAGAFLLRVAAATGDARCLREAERYGAWLASVAVRDRLGCSWPMRVAGAHSFTEFAKGVAGVGYFLLELHRATGTPRWADLAVEAEATLAGLAERTDGEVTSPTFIGESPRRHPPRPVGAAGRGAPRRPGLGGSTPRGGGARRADLSGDGGGRRREHLGARG